LFLLWLFHVPPSSQAVPILAYGDSSIEGLRVDAVAFDPGTITRGNDNTPGGEDLPQPEEKKPEPPKAEPPPPEPELPKPPPKGEAVPKQPDPSDPVTVRAELPKPMKPAVEPTTVAKNGSGGGAALPQGTPSMGGRVGSRSGVKMVGAARLEYPRE